MEDNSQYQESIFAAFFQKMEDVISSFKKLSKDERHIVLMRLVEEGHVSYPDFSKMYVEVLQKERDEKSRETATLSLYLGVLLDDQSPDTEYMRRFLWEKGYHRTSAYGDRLDKEFKDKK